MEKVKIAICGACLVIVAILGYCYISEKQNEKYEYIVNSAISNIVDTVIEKYPDVEKVINKLAGKIDEKTMINLNYKVDELGQSPEKVAHDFLVEQKLIKE